MRLIDVDALWDKICQTCDDDIQKATVEDVIIEVLYAPTVDAIPVVHGHWVWDENGMDWGLGAWRCSVCGCKPETWWEADRKYIPRRCSGSKFCGNCGAKMDEVV